MLADILQHASIKSDAVDEERSIIIDEIGRESDDPIASLTDTVRGIFYDSSSAYGRPITGSVDDVRSVTRDEVAQFYSTYYVPNNVTVVVSGDVTPTEVDSLVDEQFHNWKRSISLPDEGSAFASHYASVPTDASRIHRYLTQRDANQSYVVMAFSAPSVSDTPDAWTMDVLLTLLGQGPNNRLDTSLRQKLHLVDSISADYLTQRDPGVFTIAVSLPTSNVDVVQADILDQVRKVREAPVSDSELQRAKNALKSSYLFDVDTDSGHADSLGFYDSIGTYQYDVQYLDHVSSVTAEALMQVAQKYLDPDAYTVALQVPTPDVSTACNAQSNPRLTMTTAWSDQK